MRSISTEVQASPDVILTEMPDGTGVLLHMRTKFYYALNSSGVFIWKNLEKTKVGTVDGLSAALHREFQVDLDAARGDVAAILSELCDEELVLSGERSAPDPSERR